MSRQAAGITFLHKIFRRIWKHAVVQLGDAQARIVVQLDHQTLHLLILRGDSGDKLDFMIHKIFPIIIYVIYSGDCVE